MNVCYVTLHACYTYLHSSGCSAYSNVYCSVVYQTVNWSALVTQYFFFKGKGSDHYHCKAFFKVMAH